MERNQLSDQPRLIEVAFPLKQASLASVHEKNVRHGHISTLQPLSAIDFLPSALPTAWSDEAEPKTTVEALYAAIKTIRGKPWPEKLFLDGLNAAIGQGFIHRPVWIRADQFIGP
jgi:hypothetical protein